jgi:hypothetical protein
MKRTEYFPIVFKDGMVDGWVFRVPEAFRSQLDIEYSELVDKARSRALRKRQPKNEDGSLPTVHRMAWTQGNPPLLSFDVGHVFYDPPYAGTMVWADAVRVLQRAVEVMEARPDELPGSGWVKVTIRYFDDGEVVETRSRNLSQVEFVAFLRTGQLPAEQACDSESPARAA